MRRQTWLLICCTLISLTAASRASDASVLECKKFLGGWSEECLLNKVKQKEYLFVRNVPDNQLQEYIRDNSNSISTVLLQVDYGRDLSNYLNDRGAFVHEAPFIEALRLKVVEETLKKMIDALDALHEPPPVVAVLSNGLGVISTIKDGIEVYVKGVGVYTKVNTSELLREYFASRYRGSSPASTWTDLDRVYRPVLLTLANASGISADKDRLGVWFENSYTAYRLVGYEDSANIRFAMGRGITKLATSQQSPAPIAAAEPLGKPGNRGDQATDYFLLDRVGATWEYAFEYRGSPVSAQQSRVIPMRSRTVTNEGAATFRGTNATRFRYDHVFEEARRDSAYSYFVPTKDGVVLLGGSSNKDGSESVQTNNPPRLIFKVPPTVGMTWVHTGTIESSTGQRSIRFEMTILGQEPITVPAGHFNALKIQYVAEQTRAFTWRAPGIGEVMSDNPLSGGQRVIARLTRFSLAETTAASSQKPPAQALQLIQCDKSARFSEIKVEVGPSVDLADDSVARQILAEGAAFSREKCPITRGFANIQVTVSQPGAQYERVCSLSLTGIKTICVVRGRNYEQDKLTWQEYTNLALDARLADERRRQADEQRRVAEARQRAEQERVRQQNEARAAALEADKRAKQVKFEEFSRRYGVQQWVRDSELVANPFVFQGKVVATQVTFQQMISETEGLFAVDGSVPTMILASSVPRGLFRVKAACILVGRVLGAAEVAVPMLGKTQGPKLSFVGAHVCSDWYCSDFWPAGRAR